MALSPLTRLRRLCLALPEAQERETWERPTFRVHGKIFAMAVMREARPTVVFKAPPHGQTVLIEAAPERFYVPAYVGPKGWVGAWLDGADWDEIAGLVRRSYDLVAPRGLAAALDPTAARTGHARHAASQGESA